MKEFSLTHLQNFVLHHPYEGLFSNSLQDFCPSSPI
jgi:hypothetical protein